MPRIYNPALLARRAQPYECCSRAPGTIEDGSELATQVNQLNRRTEENNRRVVHCVEKSKKSKGTGRRSGLPREKLHY